MTNQISRSNVLKLAHKLKTLGYNFGTAQRLAWSALKAKTAMKNNIVEITYTKKDGTQTSRLATLQSGFLPTPKPSSTPRKRTSHKVTFWSITDNGFRSFLPENLLSFEVIQTTQTARLAA